MAFVDSIMVYLVYAIGFFCFRAKSYACKKLRTSHKQNIYSFSDVGIFKPLFWLVLKEHSLFIIINP